MRRRFVPMVVTVLLGGLACASPASAWNVKSANGDVSITNVHLDGGSSWVKTYTSDPVTVTFDYSIHDPCMFCFDQLEVGWSSRGPSQCVYDGQPLGTTVSGTASFSLANPVGTGFVAVDQGSDYSCGQTLPVPGTTWWNGNPPDPDTRLVGMDLEGGAYRFDYSGTIEGLLQISHVHINGHLNQATVQRGATVTVDLTYNFRDTLCRTCTDEIEVGLANDPTPVGCIGSISDGQGYGPASFSFTAPTKRGSYFLAFDRADNPGGCPSSWWTTPLPQAQPGPPARAGDTQFMGHLTVK